MRPSNPFLASSLSLLAMASACETDGQPPAPSATCSVASPLASDDQPTLAPPAGTQMYLGVYAEGAQLYTCKAAADGSYAWSFKAPQAKLYDERCQQIGTHFAGPTWQLDRDGSAVTGVKIAEAATPGAIPLLLLGATPKAPDGMLASATHIQRLATTGGLPPTDPCDATTAGRETGTFYTATYLFYRTP